MEQLLIDLCGGNKKENFISSKITATTKFTLMTVLEIELKFLFYKLGKKLGTLHIWSFFPPRASQVFCVSFCVIAVLKICNSCIFFCDMHKVSFVFLVLLLQGQCKENSLPLTVVNCLG